MNTAHPSVAFLSVSYFLFFAILGIFLPYFNLYCYSLKFSSTQIGMISAALALMKFASPLLWAYLADTAWSRKKISLTTSLASAMIFVVCLFVTDFKIMLISMTLYGFFRTAIVPLIEASTWEAIDSGGGEYGRIRVWGSVGFILASLLGGWFLDVLPLKTALYAITILAFLLFLVCFKIPDERLEQAVAKETIRSVFTKPSIVSLMLIAILMQISHGTFYGFYTIYMEELGFSRTVVGASWALSVICEVLLMTQYERWFGGWKPIGVMALSCFIAAWRWFVMGHSDSLVFILLAQGTHAFSFAAFHVASLTYLNKQIPAQFRTSGQALLSSLSYGLGGMIGLGLSGFLYDRIGGQSLFNLSSLFALGGGLTALVHHLMGLRHEQGRFS